MGNSYLHIGHIYSLFYNFQNDILHEQQDR